VTDISGRVRAAGAEGSGEPEGPGENAGRRDRQSARPSPEDGPDLRRADREADGGDRTAGGGARGDFENRCAAAPALHHPRDRRRQRRRRRGVRTGSRYVRQRAQLGRVMLSARLRRDAWLGAPAKVRGRKAQAGPVGAQTEVGFGRGACQQDGAQDMGDDDETGKFPDGVI